MGLSNKTHAGVPSRLGVVERRTLEQVWDRGEVSVRDMVAAFDDRLAYTTVMTTLDRLFKKGFLQRRKVSRAFLYTATQSRSEMEFGIARNVLTSVMDTAARNTDPVLAFIVDTVTEHDRELLADLDRIIQAKKKELEVN